MAYKFDQPVGAFLHAGAGKHRRSYEVLRVGERYWLGDLEDGSHPYMAFYMGITPQPIEAFRTVQVPAHTFFRPRADGEVAVYAAPVARFLGAAPMVYWNEDDHCGLPAPAVQPVGVLPAGKEKEFALLRLEQLTAKLVNERRVA